MTNQPKQPTLEAIAKPSISTDEANERFDALFGEAKKFCIAVGLRADLVREVFNSPDDWTFILKIDALLETATKEIIKSGLKLKILDRFVGGEALADFVDSLAMDGKTSVLKLLKASGCPVEDYGFVRAVRSVRNAYAHDIKLADFPLIEVIKQRAEKSHILKNISNVVTYDEADLVAMFEKDRNCLRFTILDATMRILFYAYHIAFKRPSSRRRQK